MIEVKLNWTEMWIATGVGRIRQLEALKKNLPDKYGFNGDGWSIHIEGACGELAVAKALNMYWAGTINTFKSKADVGKLEVRTRSRHDYDLLVRPDDKDESVFIHVTGKAPDFRIHGWLLGKDAKQEKFLQNYGGRDLAYFVPATSLNNINDLSIK